MPNDPGIEMHRFNNEDDARDGNRAIERLEWPLRPGTGLWTILSRNGPTGMS
jgi:hypothetical protein